MENNYIDLIASNALKDLEIPYNPDDWEAMDKMLDDDKGSRSKLFFYKSLEFVGLILAVWLLFQFVASTKTTSPSTAQKATGQTVTAQAAVSTAKEHRNTMVAEQEVNQNSTPSASVQNQDDFGSIHQGKKTSSEKVLQTASTSQNEDLTNAATNHNALNTKLKKPIVGTNKANTTNFARNAKRNKMRKEPSTSTTTPYTTQGTKTTATQALVDEPIATRLSIKNNTPVSTIPSTNLKEKNTNTASLVIPIEGKDGKVYYIELPVNVDEEALLAKVSRDPLPKLKQNRPTHLRIFASPDMNMKDKRYSLGASAGAVLSKELNQYLQIQSGLVYNHKQFSFSPGDIVPVAEDPVQLASILISEVEIPLNLEFTIKKSVNWRPFAVVGLSGHFIAYSKYDYDLIPADLDPSQFEFEYSNKEKGLIHGGNFKANNYYTVNLGLGLERQLTKDIHLFIQPTFKAALDGMGAKDEKLNTFSLIMGARKKL